jgi:CrcB protein
MNDSRGADMAPARRRIRLRLPPPRSIALVAVGGALGAVARVAVGVVVPVADNGWPWATMAVNLSGALVLGGLLRVISESLIGGAWARPLIGTGIVGSFTTFSTLSVEIERLAATGRGVVAAGYAGVTLVGGLLAVWIGSAAGVAMLRRGSDR